MCRQLNEIRDEFEKIQNQGMDYTLRNKRFDSLISELEQIHGKLPFPLTSAPDDFINKESVQLQMQIDSAKYW